MIAATMQSWLSSYRPEGCRMTGLTTLSAAPPAAVSVLIAACLSLALEGRSHAQQSVAASPMPPAAMEILSRMEKELAIARTKAIRDLDKVLKETTKKGDLAGAMKVKEAMDALQSEITSGGPAMQLVGRWQPSVGSEVDLFANGSAKSSAGSAGKWSFGGGVIFMEFSSGTRYELRPSSEGMTGQRIEKTGERSASSWKRLP
jgi:hypothetical protein